MTLDQKIEGLLFFKGEPMTREAISAFFKVDQLEIQNALDLLAEKLKDRGIVLIYKDNAVMLGTQPELGPIFEEMRKEELSKELSKASLETLTIVLYKGKATRSEIDYIRGVNSGFILRNLLVRGLVEKEIDSRDSRRFAYKPTFDLLGYLGITRIDELPDYISIRNAMDDSVLQNQDNESPEEKSLDKEAPEESENTHLNES